MHSLLWGAYFSTEEVKSEESIMLIITVLWFPNCVFPNRKTSWEWAKWGPTQFISVIPSPSSLRPWLSQIHNHTALETWPENPSWDQCLATYFLPPTHRPVDIPIWNIFSWCTQDEWSLTLILSLRVKKSNASECNVIIKKSLTVLWSIFENSD